MAKWPVARRFKLAAVPAPGRSGRLARRGTAWNAGRALAAADRFSPPQDTYRQRPMSENRVNSVVPCKFRFSRVLPRGKNSAGVEDEETEKT